MAKPKIPEVTPETETKTESQEKNISLEQVFGSIDLVLEDTVGHLTQLTANLSNLKKNLKQLKLKENNNESK